MLCTLAYLALKVNVTTALRLNFTSVIDMCIYVPYATSTPETEMVASFKKVHIACTWNHECDALLHYVTLILTQTVKFAY